MLKSIDYMYQLLNVLLRKIMKQNQWKTIRWV